MTTAEPPLTGFSRAAIEVGMIAQDAARLAEFYGQVIGLPLHYSQENEVLRVWYFWCGHSRVKMSEHADPPPHPHPGGGPFASIGLSWFTLPVGDVAVVVDRCVRAGSSVRVPLTETIDGGRFAVVADPEGNWVELRDRAGVDWSGARFE